MNLPINKVIHGNCIEVMRQWSDECIDFILTDPPWMISSEVVIHRSMNPMKYRAKTSIRLDFGEWDHFEDKSKYWKFTERWLSESVRVLKYRGHLVTFFDQNKVSTLIDLAESLNLKVRQHLYWLKSNPVPRARKVDFMVALEHAIWFTKGTKAGATFNYHLGQRPNYVIAAIPNNPRLHPAQKPESVLEVWIKYLTEENDIVLDPMCGSGTTLVVAKKLGRNYIGIDISEEYCDMARRRLSEVPEKLSRWV